MKRLTLLLATASLFAATPLLAQSKAELAANDARLASRIQVLEGRMLTGDPAAERIMQRLDAMEATVRNLTGEVESLRFERDRLQSEIKAMADSLRDVTELKDRMELHLKAVDVAGQRAGIAPYGTPSAAAPDAGGLPPADMPPFGTPAPTPVTGSTPAPIPGPPGFREVIVTPGQSTPGTAVDLSALPSDGQTKLAEGKFAEAETAFAQYLAYSPDAADAGEVHYWLGESRFVQGRWADAAESFIASMKSQARGPKAPDAMVRLGASLRELGKTAEACQTLNAFGAQYPNAASATKDKAKLERERTGC